MPLLATCGPDNLRTSQIAEMFIGKISKKILVALNVIFKCFVGLLTANVQNVIKGVISTGQTRLRFGSVWFRSVHFGRMRGQNHVRFTLVQHGVCLHNKF